VKLFRLAIFGVLCSFVAAVPSASAAAPTSAVSGSYSGPGTLANDCTNIGVVGTAQGDIAPFGPSTFSYHFCLTPPSPPQYHQTLVPGGTASISTGSGTVSGTLTGTQEGLSGPDGRFPYHFTLAVTSSSGTFSGTTGTIVLDGSFSAAATNITGTASGTVSFSRPAVAKRFSDCRGQGWKTVTDARGRPFRSQFACDVFVFFSRLQAHVR
jgi:hypothetical protein